MRKFYFYLQKRAQNFFRVLTYLISIFLLLYLYPHKGSFPYEFQKGKSWMHEDLIASFDFPIKKSEIELKTERDSILKEFKPYFNYNENVSSEQLKRIDKSFSILWSNYSAGRTSHTLNFETISFFKKASPAIQEKYKKFISELLNFVYEKGIIQLTEEIENYSNKDFSLVILKNKIGEEYEFSDVFSPKAAYAYIAQRVESLKDGNKNDQVIYSSGFYKELDLNEFLVPNLIIDNEATKNVKNELIKQISINKGMFLSGRKVIGKGEIVNDEKYSILSSLKYEFENKIGKPGNNQLIYLGHGIIISILLLLLLLFLAHFRRDVYKNNLKYSFILLLVVSVVGISGLIVRPDVNYLYALPFALLPIIIKTFYDARLALFVHTVAILLTGFIAPNGFEFVFLNFIAGSVATISLTNIYRRRKLFETSFYVFITYSLLYSGIFLLQGNMLQDIDKNIFVLFAISSVLLLMAYPLIYLFERFFGFLSDITLLELSDTNQVLLRQLNEKAPGTFQHSLQVANLAEEAAFRIGANPLLVRAGALYHDIGKMHNPMYFIENLSTEKNPHDSISFEASAKVIIDHVTRGVEIARKYKLPEQIVDFIRTHHGTSTAQFFYISFKKQNPDSEIDKTKFTYLGPIPYSKETALVMMADSVEAASRSIKEFNKDVIDDLIDNIVYFQMINDQYNNSNITYKDITIIKDIFKRKLMNIYHVRLEYPEMD
jgi:cyclic-di-AMP phosphodiesterase PgpH